MFTWVMFFICIFLHFCIFPTSIKAFTLPHFTASLGGWHCWAFWGRGAGLLLNRWSQSSAVCVPGLPATLMFNHCITANTADSVCSRGLSDVVSERNSGAAPSCDAAFGLWMLKSGRTLCGCLTDRHVFSYDTILHCSTSPVSEAVLF